MLVSWLCSVQAGAEVVAAVDRSQVVAGEVFELKILSAGNALGEEPDLAPLYEDFEILARSRSLRTRVINGQRDASLEWRIELLAREPGQRVIPPLALGLESTEALAVTVVAQAADLASSQARSPGEKIRGVELLAEVDRGSPYVQEQVTLNLRLESDLPLTGGALSEPEIPGAMVEKLGEDRSERIQVDGRDVHVFERRYAIFPQQSGELRVPSLVFEGTLREVESGRARRRRPSSPFGSMIGGSLFDDFFSNSGSLLNEVFGSRGRPVRAVSQPIVLAIRERPAEAGGERWLPAQELELVELWGEGDSEPPSLRVGEPVNRVVAVRARGVTASQLPLPKLAEAPGLKQYTEPAYEDSQGVDREMVALRALPTVLIPTEPGTHILPEVEIEWWDTGSDQARIARLPPRTLEVAPARGAAAAAGSAPPLASTEPSPPAGGSGAPSVGPGQEEAAPFSGVAVALGLALVMGLVGYGGWHRFGGKPRESSPQPRRRQLEKRLKEACSTGDAVGAESALLALGRACWPELPPRTPTEWTRRLASSELEAAIRGLSQHRFSAEVGMCWDGEGLWQAYRASEPRGRRFSVRARKTSEALLPELYPAR